MKLLLVVSLFLLGCGNEAVECAFKGCPKKQNPVASEPVTEEQIIALKNLKSQIEPWLLFCEGGIMCHEKDNGELDNGDSMLFGGLRCSAGNQTQCDAVKAAQDSTTGQLYRSPAGSRGTNDSSRDMLLGFLCYLTTTKDKDAATKLIDYIEDNDYTLCDNATDNRCQVSRVQHSAIWGTMKRVWQHIGLTPTAAMETGDLSDEEVINLQSKFSSEGFPLHLVGVELLLRQGTNTFTAELQNAANNLLSRQPNNPFFEYLAKGKTKRAAQLVLDQCPTSQPSPRKQWTWQRAEEEQAHLESNGHDCIFMIDVLSN